MEDVFVLDNVVKIYKMDSVETIALNGVSLRVEKGEFIAIMGPSGSGKSTMMHLMGCLDRPTSGKIYFEGKDVSTLSDDELAEIRNKKIGFVFQSFYLLPRYDALQNVELPLIYRGVPPKERREKAKLILEKIGLGDRLHHRPTQLSGGQQQRVAIARALIVDPVVLLADEPTGNLDSKSSHEIMELISRLHKEENLTIVLVTHEADIASYAEKIIRMQDGKIVDIEDRKREISHV
ncbi:MULTISPECIES: ABC transporter ATP-binding protein [Dictyoglomus]|jgi:putative ABC transport system ATP-binding protein|uniref:ABC transporter related n=1 Tax=Dictyoglomus turgidum (strain DSM 6724 / Z-1310) TaxID=515635 RepID=B8E033_DICTD|nr:MULTISPECIES: ABC transporter ATP-binding protein [Dictyoglomus]ACK42116.1 ABC transporter related [Dictyoglomus turgidum DSM 6724]HBU32347.1 ABC transporter ATP-binding protein [Dictyoglomus sp.]